MICENICSECGSVLHTLLSEEDYNNGNLHSIKCPECGKIVNPCNECDSHDKCDNCPYGGTVVNPMTELEYLEYLYKNERSEFANYENGVMGEEAKEIAKKIKEGA